MKRGSISSILTGVLLFNLIPFGSTVAATSPEEQCFAQLVLAASTNPSFNTLDLASVNKVNGKNNEYKSGRFSVATYADFLNTFSKAVPYFETDIVSYPDKMNEVPTRYKYTPTVHKSNRNNTASIIYNNGTKTNIDHWMSKNGSSTSQDIQKYFAGQLSASTLDNKHNRQKIDGYYLDSKYVSFGKESELDFSYPSRAANPGADGYYPTGRPVKDMRQYLIYTHHLSPARGGAFLSCELVKMTPYNPYKLKDYDYQGQSLSWVNYGGTKMSQSNAKTAVVGGGKFRKAEIDYTITTRADESKNLMRFNAISINYDNGNSFLNTFRTSEMFNEAMRDALNASETFLEMRRAFYNKVIASGLGIGGGASGGAANANVVKGNFCGFSISNQTNAQRNCQGLNPKTSCPAGYTKSNFARIGSNDWFTCVKTNTAAISTNPVEQGLWCGMKMTGDTARMVPCAGSDPQTTCPTGYSSKRFAQMGDNGGDWYSCFKDNNNNNLTVPSGSMCGLKMAQNSGGINCETSNPQVSCPTGFTSIQWSNVDPNWGRWFSCFKDVEPLAVNPPPAPEPTSGTVICTHYNQKGLLSDELYEFEKAYGKSVNPDLYAGYLFWATPFVAWLEKNEWADPIVAPLVNAWANEVAFQMGEKEKGNLIGRKMMQYGEPATLLLGQTALVKNKNNAAKASETTPQLAK
ncbi:hypothetical protein GW756_03950 [bacterium]|nr:hypothetical protein [bacterium]NCQ55245.1 hypothetical protein [Candidatus Parcubacteria bacterium]NCS67242.1 hypothetical protein [Candidatus Peregrinibacteria bacterium]NCS96497.1 hypothetical protein [bacterium]